MASPPLRQLQLAWVGSILGGWAYLVALGVYAYDQGGAAAVGLVGLIRLIPAAVAAPFTSALVDRFQRVGVMVASDLVRCALLVGRVADVQDDAPVTHRSSPEACAEIAKRPVRAHAPQ